MNFGVGQYLITLFHLTKTVSIDFTIQFCVVIFLDQPWCAVSVDTSGNMLTWDYCDATCPHATAETTPQMVSSPDNAEGNCCEYFYHDWNSHQICLIE